MILVAILSIILIWLHISSLRFIIKTNSNHSIIEETEKLESVLLEEERNISLTSGPGLASLVIIILLNLIEIGYFTASVYFFGGLIITVGSSILIGYTLYSLVKFIPNIKKYYSKPSEYLKEKTTGFENILSFIMTSFEIIFCLFVLVKVIIQYRLFENL